MAPRGVRDMVKIITGNIFNSNADAIAVPSLRRPSADKRRASYAVAKHQSRGVEKSAEFEFNGFNQSGKIA